MLQSHSNVTGVRAPTLQFNGNTTEMMGEKRCLSHENLDLIQRRQLLN